MMTVNLDAAGKGLKNNAVLDGWQCVFFCIPKVANSSIKAALLAAMGFSGKQPVVHKHPALNLQRPEYVAMNCANYLKFAVVRNTYDRLVSCYVQKICTWRVEKQGFKKRGFFRNMPFDEYIKLVCSKPHANAHFYPQMDAICYRDRVLPDYIGSFERLAEDWDKFVRRSRMPLGDLPHHNRSERRDYKEYFTPALVEMVNKAYAEEIKYFKFRF